MFKEIGRPLWLSDKSPSVNAGGAGPITGLRNPQEKETAAHSSVLAWRVLWTAMPSRLHSGAKQATDQGVTKEWDVI